MGITEPKARPTGNTDAERDQQIDRSGEGKQRPAGAADTAKIEARRERAEEKAATVKKTPRPKKTPAVEKKPTPRPRERVKRESVTVEEIATDRKSTARAWDGVNAGDDLTLANIQQTSLVIISLLNGLANLLYGSGAQMTSAEKKLIQEPLERVLQRFDIVKSGVMGQWVDPIMLVMGLAAWGSRLRRENAQRQALEKNNTAVVEPAKVDKSNGSNDRPRSGSIELEEIASAMSGAGIVGGDMRGGNVTL